MDGASTFGRWLKQRRRTLDLTQEALAARVGCATDTIRKFEAETRRPSRPIAERLADALELPAAERATFLGRAREQPGQAATPRDVADAQVAAASAAAPRPRPAEVVPLLKTKLYVPRPRADLVPRPRLYARLDAGLRGRLTVVAAPAGFGKSTLLANWIHQRTQQSSPPRVEHAQRPAFAWLSLDRGDTDPILVLRYLIAALQTISPDVGRGALQLLEAGPSASPMAVLPLLINDLDQLPEPSILILDDYHVIDTPAVHAALQFLLDHLPPQLRLVIASRTDPDLPLARWRVRRELTELRAADLRFTADEAATFVRDVMGVPLSAADITMLEARTEGWIAGLQLAALSLQDRPADQIGPFIAAFAGSHHYVVDYLVNEVLARLPAHLQTFLLQTSILDRLCGPLCDAVLGLSGQDAAGTTNGASREATAAGLERPAPGSSYSRLLLAELERMNLFLVPLDDERNWYRYHHLFADVVRSRLGSGASLEEVRTLHRRAGGWFEQQGLLVEAIDHVLAGGDVVRAAELIEAHVLETALHGRAGTVASWLDALPAELRTVRPRLSLARVWVHFVAGAYALIEPCLREAEAALHYLDEPDAAALAGELVAIRALALTYLDDPRAVDLARQALAETSPDHQLYGTMVIMLGLATFRAGNLAEAGRMLEQVLASERPDLRLLANRMLLLAVLALVRLAQGRLRQAASLCGEALGLAERDGRLLPMAGAMTALRVLSMIALEQHDLESAERLLRQYVDLAREAHNPVHQILPMEGQAQALWMRGDLAGALDLITQAEAAARQQRLSANILREMDGFRVLVWLKQGNLAAAAAWAAAREGVADADRPRLTPYDNDRLAAARLRIAQGEWDAAHAALARLLSDAEATGHGRFLIRTLILQALAWQARGDTLQALIPLERALLIAEPEGYVHSFVDEGAPMAALLRQARARGVTPNYVRALLEALEERFEDAVSQPLTPDRRPSPQLDEPLTERELEVLRLLAEGYSSAAIAEKLVVAVGTVKRHVANIMGKLEVHSRLQVLVRARELDLL